MIEELIGDYPETDNAVRRPNKGKSKAQPFLQWVGGKREFISIYGDYLPSDYNSFHEPFLGGGAVFFEIAHKESFISDLNKELIDTYLAIRDEPEAVISILEKLRSKHSKELYYHVRAFDRLEQWQTATLPEIAARMIYLNQTGFNGLYRVNRKGQYNVPIGSSLNRLICDPENLRAASVALGQAKISYAGYESVLDNAKADDFVFLDPPYAPAGEFSDFVRYTKEQFSLDDQKNVASIFQELDKLGTKVALTNADVPLIRELYKDYTIVPILSSRNLNSKKDLRGKAKEVLVVNYELEKK